MPSIKQVLAMTLDLKWHLLIIWSSLLHQSLLLIRFHHQGHNRDFLDRPVLEKYLPPCISALWQGQNSLPVLLTAGVRSLVACSPLTLHSRVPKIQDGGCVPCKSNRRHLLWYWSSVQSGCESLRHLQVDWFASPWSCHVGPMKQTENYVSVYLSVWSSITKPDLPKSAKKVYCEKSPRPATEVLHKDLKAFRFAGFIRLFGVWRCW